MTTSRSRARRAPCNRALRPTRAYRQISTTTEDANLRLPRAAIDETSFSCVLSIHAPVGISLYGAGESSDTRPLSFRIRTLHYMMPETEEKSPDTDARVSANDRQLSEDDSEPSSRRHSHGLMRRSAILGGALDLIRKPSNGKFKGRHEKL